MSLFLAACAPARVSERPSRLPDVTVVALDARPVRLTELLAGKPALVSFWATWCTACEREFDALNRLDRASRDKGAVVLGVAVGEPRAKVAAFAAARGLAFLELADEDFHLADALGERALPATLVVDRAGRIVFRGAALDARALAAFERAIAQP